MGIMEILVVVFGLMVFEIISSVDNAIINAHVLKTLPTKFRKFFLLWGMLIAVFVVRGILPFLIVWLVNPALSLGEVWSFVFSNDPRITQYVEQSKGILLVGGGIYLFLIFLSWLFLEEKKYAFLVEHFIHKRSAWFYAISSLTVTVIVYVALKIDPMLAFAASIGSTAFFITDGFKKNAEEKEQELLTSNVSAWSKILYLEVLDASFSIDGVIGAFAFTVSVPLILLGNGVGALVVRELTIRGMGIITKLAYLKNGAMYSIGMLGGIMVLESLGQHYPFWLAPLNTLLLLGVFLYLSYSELKLSEQTQK
ncbi:MAG: hypothetical protein ACD_14C00007G0003 [uncultured bacterium]|nr:MAG: hypothetical protein ACD_14C00007G0003 [uncultured bacterium]KKQ44762.1 MAG: putative membrane protein [Candidatus Moranbacteria bacterium GW2011_GWC2_37_8]KKQ79695.1 MAG: putative membrane protein [Candidatus Moranbacteria bacterium GW2011_GWD2_38_7]